MSNSKNTVNWELIDKLKEQEEFKCHWIPYGFPEIVDPFTSVYADVDLQPKWDIPDKIVISQTINGAFYSKASNPNIPVSPEEILAAARECAELNPSTVHIHVRNEEGHNVLDPELYNKVIGPLREEYPLPVYDGCMVPFMDGEWDKMISVLSEQLLEVTPVNSTACFCGDTLFAKPPHVLIEKTRLCQELGVKPQIAVYSDGDIDNADRYLIKSGLIDSPSFWIILPTLPGGTPMHSPRQMMKNLMHSVESIYDIDPDAIIVVCASGRASSYLATAAILLGLHIRVGMEDTIWKYPHKNEKIVSNAECFKTYKTISECLGRECATGDEYRALIGLPTRGDGKPATA